MINKCFSKRNNGFTIVELLVATAVFSAVMLGASATVLQITRLYYKGIAATKTQTVARNLLESISRPIQLQKETLITADKVTPRSLPPSSYEVKAICIGTTRISYVIGLETDSGVNFDAASTKIKHATWKDEVPTPQDCTSPAYPPADLTKDIPTIGGTDVISQNMRLSQLDIKPTVDNPGLWNIEVVVLYGGRDLMLPSAPDTSVPTGCSGAVAGSQWCAKADYSTKAYKRIADTSL